jgi:xylan 1,4-beta-xylosidase
MRDHQIIRVDDRWYMTGTSQPIWGGRNPGIRLLVSDDLLHWKHQGWLVDALRLPDECPYNGRFWAPEIHRAQGKFWLTVNSGSGIDGKPERMHAHAIWLFVSDHVAGPYERVTKDGPIGKPFKNDASLFTDEDGQSYLYCSGGGLWQAEIDLPAGRLVGRDDLEKIMSPRDPGIPDWRVGGIEGPFVIKRFGNYYMFFSAWTRGYEIGVLSASSPLGPWQQMPGNPIFGSRKRRYREPQMKAGRYAHITFEDTADPYVETGHCAIFEGPDAKDWLCCHYFLEGSRPILSSPVIEYEDTQPQLGIEPLHFRNGRFAINGPTSTEQIVQW